MYFPRPDFDEPEIPGHPMAVLYDGLWWWSVDELPGDQLMIERYVGSETIRKTIHLDEVSAI